MFATRREDGGICKVPWQSKLGFAKQVVMFITSCKPKGEEGHVCCYTAAAGLWKE